MQLIPVLNRLGQKTKKIFPHINNGGCCVFAALVGEALRQKGVQVRVVVADHNAIETPRTIEDVRGEISNGYVADHNQWHSRSIYFHHLGLEIETEKGTRLYDANGVIPNRGEIDGVPLYNGRMKLDDAKALADNPNAWNPAFDRDDIPRLRLLVKSELKLLTVEPVPLTIQALQQHTRAALCNKQCNKSVTSAPRWSRWVSVFTGWI